MSTRGAIARRTGSADWEGRYHHFDSYESGLGRTLIELYHGHFARDLERMLAVLIDEHPAGWSSINGCDWTQEPGFENFGRIGCVQCGQNLAAHLTRPPGGGAALSLTDALGHEFERDYDTPRRPICYCHGDLSEGPSLVTSWHADDSVEYVYVFPSLVAVAAGVRAMTVLEAGRGRRPLGRWNIRGDVDLNSRCYVDSSRTPKWLVEAR